MLTIVENNDRATAVGCQPSVAMNNMMFSRKVSACKALVMRITFITARRYACAVFVIVILSEVVLAQLVVFNKRRGNEPATMLVSAYVNRPNWKDKSSKEVVSCLQPMEKVLMERMDLVQVPGKRNRRVPILITPEVRSAMNLLLHTRDDCSVPSQNRFFFATDSTAGHLDSWLVLHNCARDAGVTNPRLITSRSLRKYVATLAQVILSCF